MIVGILIIKARLSQCCVTVCVYACLTKENTHNVQFNKET